MIINEATQTSGHTAYDLSVHTPEYGLQESPKQPLTLHPTGCHIGLFSGKQMIPAGKLLFRNKWHLMNDNDSQAQTVTYYELHRPTDSTMKEMYQI